MKKELYTHFHYLNSLFKTTELKISENNNLEINELSIWGNSQQTINLMDGDIGVKIFSPQSNFSLIIPILLLGSLVTSFTQIFTTSPIGYLLTFLSIMLVVTSSFFLFFKLENKKFFCIYNLSNGKEIYKIPIHAKSSTLDKIEDFIGVLDLKLSDNYVNDTYPINCELNSEKEDQYSNLMYNLECLYNSGVLDDNSFNRIELNIHQKLYPTDNIDKQSKADIIYLHNY